MVAGLSTPDQACASTFDAHPAVAPAPSTDDKAVLRQGRLNSRTWGCTGAPCC